MKKSSLALLLAVLVLLTGILVGTAVTASAEDEYTSGASVYGSNGAFRKHYDTFAEALSYCYGQASATADQLIIKLYEDIELTADFTFATGKLGEIDGQGHTIYFDSEFLKAEVGTTANAVALVSISSGKAIFRNVNFVGQDMDWSGKAEDAVSFGAGANQAGGAFYIGSGAHVEFIGCSLKHFYGSTRTSAIYLGNMASTAETYNVEVGLWLEDTVITDNHALISASGSSANAVSIPQNWNPAKQGSSVHILGNTVVENNYDMNGNASANIWVARANTIQSSSLIVDPGFTGRVGVVSATVENVVDTNRGSVFFVTNEDGDVASGTVFAVTPATSLVVPTGEVASFEDVYSGYWATTSTTSNVTMTVLDATGTKELFAYTTTLTGGVALPTWATWSDGENTVTTHASLTNKAYTGKVTANTGVLYSKDNGATWTYGADVYAALSSAKTVVEVLGDVALTANVGVGYHYDMTFDFNGYTVTRNDPSYLIKAEGISSGSAMVRLVIKNAIFDGQNDGGATILALYKTHHICEVDNVIFRNFNGAGLIDMIQNTTVYKDVNIESYTGTSKAAILVNGGSTALLEGNTQIYNKGDETMNYINGYYGSACCGVNGTFTGQVIFNAWGYQANRPTFYQSDRNETDAPGTLTANCAVAEGAKILGKIYCTNTTEWVAYNNNGTLCWTQVGKALDTTNVQAADYDPETNTLTAVGWAYKNANGDVVATSVAVADVYDYFIADVGGAAEAVVDGDTPIFGDLAYVIAAAAGGQTVEVLKDVTGINNLTISKSITLDGNGKTLTWRTSPDPTAEASNDAYMIKVSVSGALLKDVVLHGGAAEKAVWDGPLAPIVVGAASLPCLVR